MKAKSSVSKRKEARFEVPQMHYLPLTICDPKGPIDLSQDEAWLYVTAEQTYWIAKADFEKKRGAVLLKLLQGGHCKHSNINLELDEDGHIVATHEPHVAALITRS
ncbi:MAG: hypothetical protein ACREBW_10735 [Candidatus Micrarchaeaceae archaeon]